MTDSVLIALIVAIPTMFSAPLMAWITNRNRRRERLEDYARQDVVAARLAKANEAAVAARAAAAEKLDDLKAGQKEIHALVNSNMTAAMQSELDATIREHAMMLEVVALKQAAGHEPSVAALAAIEATEKKIAELQAAMRDRLKQS